LIEKLISKNILREVQYSGDSFLIKNVL